MTIKEKIVSLTKQLYPTGRAFKMPVGGEYSRFHEALAVSEAKAYDDLRSILDSILPDNDNFTSDDATDWERRLGLISNPAVSLSDRKKAIARKMNYPGVVKARQHYLWLERQLQLAGFDVYVYENIPAQAPIDVGGDLAMLTVVRHGQIRHGQLVPHGATYNNIVANHIDESRDLYFNVGDSFRCSFFIGGPTLGSYADVDNNRRAEFRQLILRIKPVQQIGFLFINYI